MKSNKLKCWLASLGNSWCLNFHKEDFFCQFSGFPYFKHISPPGISLILYLIELSILLVDYTPIYAEMQGKFRT